MITASPSDYATIQRVINKLDIPRDQIFVEVLIMEMGINKDSQYAANIVHGKSGTSIAPTSDLIGLIKDPTNIPAGMVLQYRDNNTTNVTIPGASGGTAQTFAIPNLAALIKAIQTSSNSQVVASPQIMTMDNTEATFESTDQIPTLNATAGIGGTVNNSVQFIDIPLSVKIKPQLNKISNFIKMDIKAKISDVTNKAPAGVSNIAPAKLTRNAETSVMVSDGDTVVLGGLIRDKQTETIKKVPLLGDIPILGWLFKARDATIEKTNLLLFITPRIMRQPEAVRAVLDQKLKDRDHFVETAMGGEDHQRETRNNVIRNLPDVKTIKNYNAKRVINLEDDDILKDSSKEAMNEKPTPTPAPHTAPGVDTKDTLTLPQLDQVPSDSKVAPPAVVPPSEPNSAPPVVAPAPDALPANSDPFAPIAPQSGGKTP